MKMYCFSGLGADERAFQYLHFPEHSLIHVPWLEPLVNETLKSYALRMSDAIDSTEPFILLGLSFGGMLCVEISKKLNPEFVILLSSIEGRHEMPIRMKISGALNLYHIVPNKYLTKPSRIGHFLFGAKSDQEKILLNQILLESDPKYLKWALKAISKWGNTEAISCFRIHGTADRIFPIQLLKPDFTVKSGGHLMVISHAKLVNQAINSYISLNNVKSTTDLV